MKRILFFYILSFNFLYSSCTLDDNLLLAILMNERSLKRDIGYKHIISLNNESDQKKVKKIEEFQSMMIDSRSIDCKDTSTCVEVLTVLLNDNIKNLDIGPYQVNSIYHLNRFETYYELFNIDKSRKFACDYITEKIKRLGYTWEAIAAYHSETPRYNEKYQKKLIDNYNLIVSIESQ